MGLWCRVGAVKRQDTSWYPEEESAFMPPGSSNFANLSQMSLELSGSEEDVEVTDSEPDEADEEGPQTELTPAQALFFGVGCPVHGHRAHTAAVRLPVPSLPDKPPAPKKWKKLKQKRRHPKRNASAAEELGLCQSYLDGQCLSGPSPLFGVDPTSLLERDQDDCRWPMTAHYDEVSEVPEGEAAIDGLSFDTIDLNGDGVLSRAEFAAAMAAPPLLQEKRRRRWLILQPSVRGSTFTKEALWKAGEEGIPEKDESFGLVETKAASAPAATEPERAAPMRPWRGGSNWMRNVLDESLTLRV